MTGCGRHASKATAFSSARPVLQITRDAPAALGSALRFEVEADCLCPVAYIEFAKQIAQLKFDVLIDTPNSRAKRLSGSQADDPKDEQPLMQQHRVRRVAFVHPHISWLSALDNKSIWQSAGTF